VERALQKVPGVRSAVVNLATEEAALVVDAALPQNLIEAAVTQAGYEVAAAAPGEVAASTSRIGAGWAVAISLALTLPLVAPMLLGVVGINVPALSGGAQMALATVVQFAFGLRFYRAGWAALKSGSGNMDLLVALGTDPDPARWAGMRQAGAAVVEALAPWQSSSYLPMSDEVKCLLSTVMVNYSLANDSGEPNAASSSRSIMNRDFREQLLDEYRESNAWVARTFLGREDGCLFAEPN
jgi:hypothetical protein